MFHPFRKSNVSSSPVAWIIVRYSLSLSNEVMTKTYPGLFLFIVQYHWIIIYLMMNYKMPSASTVFSEY